MSNRKPLMLESMLLDCASPDELGTFHRLLKAKRKGAATCYGMRVLRKYWAELINAGNTQDKSARQPQDSFSIPKLNASAIW